MNHRSRGRATLAALLLLLCSAASFSSSYAAVLMVPETYPTIQGAVDAASTSDTISVAPGTYTGPGNRDITIIEKSVLLRSRQGAEVTVIDCQRLGRGFYLDGWGWRPVIEGFTIRNATGTSGGGVWSLLATPTFRDCEFASNRAIVGGAVDLGLSATFEHCRFVGNEARDQGGAVSVLSGATSFVDCVLSGNFALYGGAVLSHHSSLTFTDCTITSNWSSEGGGIFAFSEAMVLERTICRDNCAGIGQEIYSNRDVTLRCSNVDLSGIIAEGIIQEEVIDLDALFCDPRACYPTEDGDYSLRADSPCLPEGNPCHVRIGALDLGCPAPASGACCLPSGGCNVYSPETCAALEGRYMGNSVPCDPDPCITPVESSSWGQIKSRFR